MLLAMRLPWSDLVKAAPIALRAADRLLRPETTGPRGPASTARTLGERVDQLEAASSLQAELIRDLARQTTESTRALRALAWQALIAIALAAAALGVSIVALARTLAVVGVVLGPPLA